MLTHSQSKALETLARLRKKALGRSNFDTVRLLDQVQFAIRLEGHRQEAMATL